MRVEKSRVSQRLLVWVIIMRSMSSFLAELFMVRAPVMAMRLIKGMSLSQRVAF